MDLLESLSGDITKWDVLKDLIESDLNCNAQNVAKDEGIQHLPRNCSKIYGNMPKMEQRVYSRCKECKLLFNPRNILSHKNCLNRSQSSLSSSFLDLKKRTKSKSSKKPYSNTPSPPPFKKLPPLPIMSTQHQSIADLSKISNSSHKSSSKTCSLHSSRPVPSHSHKSAKSDHSSHLSSRFSKTLSSSLDSSSGSSSTSSSSSLASKWSSNSSHSSSSSSRHRRSRKSSHKSGEDHHLSSHRGVIQDNKDSIHRSHLRKLVSNHKSEIHHVLSDRRISREKDIKHNNPKSYYSPNDVETKDMEKSYVHATPIKSNSLSVILPNIMSQNSTTSLGIEVDMKSTELLFNHEIDAETVPVLYMPISPVSVVNPVEYVRIGKNIIRLESPQSATSPPITTNQSLTFGIPNNLNIKTQSAQPKSVSLPSYGVKNIGGATLLSKQHQLELQRINLLMAVSSKTDNYKSSMNNSDVMYKPNILKNNSKFMGNKRSSTERLSANENKQMKLSSNLNGFFIHSKISETAEAPLSNVLENDKMTYLNIK